MPIPRMSLSRLSAQVLPERNSFRSAGTFLCVCELLNPPLREASLKAEDPKLGLRLECCERLYLSTSKPLKQNFQIFFPETPTAKKSYRRTRLTWINQWWSHSPGVTSSDGIQFRSRLPYTTTMALSW